MNIYLSHDHDIVPFNIHFMAFLWNMCDWEGGERNTSDRVGVRGGGVGYAVMERTILYCYKIVFNIEMYVSQNWMQAQTMDVNCMYFCQ